MNNQAKIHKKQETNNKKEKNSNIKNRCLVNSPYKCPIVAGILVFVPKLINKWT